MYLQGDYAVTRRRTQIAHEKSSYITSSRFAQFKMVFEIFKLSIMLIAARQLKVFLISFFFLNFVKCSQSGDNHRKI
jgi:hypothetical protein